MPLIFDKLRHLISSLTLFILRSFMLLQDEPKQKKKKKKSDRNSKKSKKEKKSSKKKHKRKSKGTTCSVSLLRNSPKL